jgi:hypothetical protein
MPLGLYCPTHAGEVMGETTLPPVPLCGTCAKEPEVAPPPHRGHPRKPKARATGKAPKAPKGRKRS